MADNKVISKGFDLMNFLSGLTHHLRNLLVAKHQQSISLLDVSESTAEKYAKQAQAIDNYYINIDDKIFPDEIFSVSFKLA